MKESATLAKSPETIPHRSSPTAIPVPVTRAPAHPLLRLQRTIGNQAVQRRIQTKLAVGAANDQYEQEADRVAEQVMRMPTSPSMGTGQAPVQRHSPEAGELGTTKPLAATVTRLVQCAASAPLGSSESAPDFEARLSTGGGGSPLPGSTRAFMEPRLGADFSGVRLHTGREAAQLNRAIHAQAFTHGSHIYLGEGMSAIGSTAGKQLLAHELVHTIQQGAAHGSMDRATSQSVTRLPVVQRQAAPAPPPVAAPSSVTAAAPAPAPGVIRPSLPSPPVGASKAETDPVELPLVGRAFITFSSTRRDLKLAKGDLSEFEILKGEVSTPPIPLLDTGVSAKFSAKADEGIRLANASLFITPIAGEIDETQIAASQSTKEKFGVVGAAAGGIIGGLVGAAAGGITGGPAGLVLGALKGAEIGGGAGGGVAETVAGIFGGAKEFTARLTQGAGGVNLALTYSPQLTMVLSATGFSWLATLETTLLTNLMLSAEALLDFGGSHVKLKFLNGRLLPSEFEIMPVVRPVFKAALDASGQLIARLVILPFLRNEKPKVGEEEAIEAAEVVSVPFHLFSWDGTFECDPILTAVKGSALDVRGKRVKADEGKVPAAFKSALNDSKPKPDTKKAERVKKPESLGGPNTGLTREDAIPLIWWKPFDEYVKELHLPASEFGTERKARRFPNKHYHNERRGIDLSLGVNNWPYIGMALKKKQNERGTEVKEFKETLAQHGVDLDRQAPGTQIDHVIDLTFNEGFDREDNFWPLDADVNMRAGGKYSNGTYLVTWAEQAGGPPINTTPAQVPIGRWFVIVDDTQLP
jgi:hypothetical protein